MMKRRKFIKNSSIAGMVSMAPFGGVNLWHEESIHLKILHTNDMHSRIEPFPDDGGRNAGLGGMARRAKLIAEIRQENENVLLLDSGDIFQGTPYFNQFGGELEFKLMSEMGYDVATIGNHDFDGGLDNLTHQMKHAKFQMVCGNYDFSDTEFAPFSQDYVIKKVDDLKIGILGVGIELEGLVPKALYGNTQYANPITKAEKIAKHLRRERNCDYVICLSHLGYKYRGDRVSDVVLAQNTSNIDLILGGHTHTFMKEADIRTNKDGKSVVIHQSGWAGILLGQIDLVFERSSKRNQIQTRSTLIS